MTDLKFRIKACSENATKTVVKARGFELIVDEPVDLGGTDEGANPVEFLLAAYAGCINVMAHVIAKEMGIKLNGIKIDLSGNLNPAKLFGQETDDRAGYKQIKANIKADTDANKDQIEILKQSIIDRCPVGDNIKNTTEVIFNMK